MKDYGYRKGNMTEHGYKMAEWLDGLFTEGKLSADDSRFLYSVGETVKVVLPDSLLSYWPPNTNGSVAKILNRRNAYPPPYFEGYWFPIYYLEGIGEIGETLVVPFS